MTWAEPELGSSTRLPPKEQVAESGPSCSENRGEASRQCSLTWWQQQSHLTSLSEAVNTAPHVQLVLQVQVRSAERFKVAW